MVQNTPQQGFSYAELVDQPCQMSSAFAQLAAQVDRREQGYDADVVRLAAPSMVRISVNGYLKASLISPIPFDTVEVNRGTPTNLTTYNGLLLNRGLWMIGLEVRWVADSGNNNSYQIVSIGSTSANGAVFLDNPAATAYTKSLATSYPASPTWYPRQFHNICELGLVTADGAKVFANSVNNADVPYQALWAVQLGDV
jgi:hypothetical protein